jgi:hypothetical protein
MKKINIKVIDVIILISAALLILLYIGFYFPDEMLLYKTRVRLLLYAVRIILPLVIIGLLSLLVAARIGKIKITNVVLLVASIFISSIIAFHAGLAIYSMKEKSSDAIKQFHPFLQLKPNEVDSAGLGDTKTFRIVCLGGSATEFKDSKGIGWPEYLERQINPAGGGGKIKVFNCGKQWYTTLHLLIHYETNIRPYRPNMIVFMEAINDLLHNADQSYFSSGPFRSDYGHFNGPMARLVSGRGFTGEIFGNLLGRLWYQKEREVLELNAFPGLASYERNLRTIIELARNDGTAVVLMTQPSLYKINLTRHEQDALYMVNIETCGKSTRWSQATARRGMEQYNGRLRRIAPDYNISVIDLEKAVPKNGLYFLDDVHYQNRAFPLIAKTIARELKAGSVIPGNYNK